MVSPLPFSFQHVRKRQDTTCAVCDNIPACPACPKGFQCQQIFRSSCQTCPVNKCVQVPGSSGGSISSGSLGGALGGVLGAAVIGLVILVLWKRAKKKRIALEQDARERRQQTQEKYKQEKEGVTIQLGSKPSPEAFDGDTEWTSVTGTPLVDTGEPLEPPMLFRRRSFGAATHLSRITEGIEEEEEEEREREREEQAAQNEARQSQSHQFRQSMSSSFLSASGPRVSISSGTTISSKNIIPITYRPAPETSHPLATNPPTMPSTAHRPVGAPHIEISSVPKQPIRPHRSPDLNLRLGDAAEPGTRFDSLLIAPSVTLQSARSSSSLGSSSPHQFEFMSIDPAAALQESRVYSRRDRPLSTATVNTLASTSTAGFDYVLSAPQIVTPVTADGARRVQLNKGGRAQLVSGSSLKKKEKDSNSPVNTPSASFDSIDPFSDAVAAASSTAKVQSQSFDDAIRNDVSLLRPTTSVYSKTSHTSVSTIGLPFAADQMVPLPDPSYVSPIDADRNSWLGVTPSRLSSSHNESLSNNPFADPCPENQSKTSRHHLEPPRTDVDRFSLATSIDGLSVFDEYPITIESEHHVN